MQRSVGNRRSFRYINSLQCTDVGVCDCRVFGAYDDAAGYQAVRPRIDNRLYIVAVLTKWGSVWAGRSSTKV